jgi:hypothetical protein
MLNAVETKVDNNSTCRLPYLSISGIHKRGKNPMTIICADVKYEHAVIVVRNSSRSVAKHGIKPAAIKVVENA